MKKPKIKKMADDFIRSTKDQISLEIAEQVILRAELAIWPADRVQLTADLKLLILDAIEFGIQLGGMDWREGE